jgi:hypothetical protein
LKTSNLILNMEFDQHLGSHKHVINIIMGFRDMGCYIGPIAVLGLNPDSGCLCSRRRAESASSYNKASVQAVSRLIGC